MKSQCALLTAITFSFALCATARADGGGTLYHNGAATALTSAYAYTAQDRKEPSKQAVEVVFSDAPIDAASLNAAKDRQHAVDSFLMYNSDRTVVKLTIGSNQAAPLEQVSLRMRTGEHSSETLGTNLYTLDLKRNDGKRIEGKFRINDATKKSAKHEDYYDLHFALDVASGPPFGSGRPPEEVNASKASPSENASASPSEGSSPDAALASWVKNIEATQKEYYENVGKWCAPEQCGPDLTGLPHSIQEIKLGANGVIKATFRPGSSGLGGKSVTITPSVGEDNTITWRCSSQNMSVNQLPQTCR